MKEITYDEIDRVLFPWARAHQISVFTEHKDEPVRAMLFLDQWGDQYEMYAIPDWENGNKTVAVGADLNMRGDKKHTFYRERKRYYFKKSIPLVHLASTLDEAWNVVRELGESSHK
jgi:hypothetical protein